ncbi:MAG: low temperature requirement protein A [Salaquimonas sp.]|nr:low temperature requirement protein A [Salaquimonas sp.]
MAGLGFRNNYLRERVEGEEARVDFSELFFDLVFVFAVTQISHYLLHHLNALGLAQAAFLVLAIWWVWVYTTWATNWLDPHRRPVRLMLFIMMLAGLFLSTSIPEAFGERGLVFATAYVVMQVGRCLFMLMALRHHSPGNFRNFQRITTWLATAGVFWIAGGLADDPTARFLWWIAAMVIELTAPAVGYRLPGLGASTTRDWDVDGGHMAERCGLFVIISLGESILIAGATFTELGWSLSHTLAFISCFVATVAMWWIYFNIGAEVSRERIAESDDPGRIARFAYTYVHIAIIAGIIVVAVGVELVLAHPLGLHAGIPVILTLIGGAALYLAGNGFFKFLTFGRWPLSHLLGLAAFAVLGGTAYFVPPLAVAGEIAVILAAVAIWEFISLRSLRH